MMNQYPIWKYLLLVIVLVVGAIYALPNVYGEDPALQISAGRNASIDEAVRDRLVSTLDTAGITVKQAEVKPGQLLIRFNDTETQLKAVDYVKSELGTNYVVALNLAPATPGWLNSLNALPMYLGLDLRGGVHFLMEVDMKAAAERALERYGNDVRSLLREARIRYAMIRAESQGVRVIFRSNEDREQSRELIRKELPTLKLEDIDTDDKPGLLATMDEPMGGYALSVPRRAGTARHRDLCPAAEYPDPAQPRQ